MGINVPVMAYQDIPGIRTLFPQPEKKATAGAAIIAVETQRPGNDLI
jgi:hypothetical protein